MTQAHDLLERRNEIDSTTKQGIGRIIDVRPETNEMLVEIAGELSILKDPVIVGMGLDACETSVGDVLEMTVEFQALPPRTTTRGVK